MFDTILIVVGSLTAVFCIGTLLRPMPRSNPFYV